MDITLYALVEQMMVYDVDNEKTMDRNDDQMMMYESSSIAVKAPSSPVADAARLATTPPAIATAPTASIQDGDQELHSTWRGRGVPDEVEAIVNKMEVEAIVNKMIRALERDSKRARRE